MTRWILQTASWLAPRETRADWLAEWTGELWHVDRAGGNAIAFCLGSYRDAAWLRAHTTPSFTWMASPAACLGMLAACAAVCVGLAVTLPGVRSQVAPAPYRDTGALAMVWRADRITVERFLTLARPEIREAAFYRIETLEGLRVAIASERLFDVLGAGVAGGSPGVVLALSTAQRRFGKGTAVGRTIAIGQVVAVIPDDWWRLSGRVDAWLLDDARVAARPRDAGYVVARMTHRVERTERAAGFEYSPVEPPMLRQMPYLFMAMIALSITALTTRFSRGEYRAVGQGIRLRRWLFFGIKTALVAVVVVCGALDLGATSVAAIQAHGYLAGLVLGFRWVIADQQRRCPVCLRRLTSPARIGSISQTFLEWYGTELLCARGHGMLHVPEPESSWSKTLHWVRLDGSWQELFAGK